ncbi:unnamed protein product [Darwinula stevensoni]|uniref:Uncharacterized protein n=1 Tax=Darwinula stevensoni TaxID=69355 RepID=A0A7R8ZZ52_9CRUS|nr:unnamed protein product [Darwinula stevensoni]CAG0882803.1 unnamed protein product [Darwinula stevensoni]
MTLVHSFESKQVLYLFPSASPIMLGKETPKHLGLPSKDEEKVAVAQLNSLFPEAVGAESNLQKGRLVPCLKSRGKRAHHIPTNKVPMP